VRIALSTGGGDAPGLNAVIRAAVLSAVGRGWTVLGIKKGYAGLMGEDEVVELTRESVRGIAHLGGTILRTTNRGNPFGWPVRQADGTWGAIDRSDELIENAKPRADRNYRRPEMLKHTSLLNPTGVNPMLKTVVNFLKREDGPTAVEYAVMLALIIVVCIGAITTLGTRANATFQTVDSALPGASS